MVAMVMKCYINYQYQNKEIEIQDIYHIDYIQIEHKVSMEVFDKCDYLHLLMAFILFFDEVMGLFCMLFQYDFLFSPHDFIHNNLCVFQVKNWSFYQSHGVIRGSRMNAWRNDPSVLIGKEVDQGKQNVAMSYCKVLQQKP